MTDLSHNTLREWRKRRGLTQEQAAALVDVSQATWCAWETGKSEPRISHALRIVRVSGGEITLAHLERPIDTLAGAA